MEPTELTGHQATIVAASFLESIFANQPIKVFSAGLVDVGRPAWLFRQLEKPGPAARDLPVNGLMLKMPTEGGLNIGQKLARTERWT